MRLLFIIYISACLLGCSSIRGQSHLAKPCDLLETIFNYKEIYSLLGLSNATEVRPNIRVFDLSNRFTECRSLYKSNSLDFSIPYHIEASIKPSINTGTYRDIVIHTCDLDRSTNKGSAILSVAAFETHNNVNTNFKIALDFEFNNQSFEITNIKMTEYIDHPPGHDYEK